MVSTIEPLLSELNIAVGQAKDGTLPEQARMEALQAATKLAAALEKPEDALLKIAYSVRSSPLNHGAVLDENPASDQHGHPLRCPDGHILRAFRERGNVGTGACEQVWRQ